MSIDLDKPLRQKVGLAVRIIARDLKGNYPLAAAVTYPEGCEKLERYTFDGRYYHDSGPTKWDLENVPETHRIWLNIYGNGHVGGSYRSKAAANNMAANDRVACVPVDVTPNGEKTTMVQVAE